MRSVWVKIRVNHGPILIAVCSNYWTVQVRGPQFLSGPYLSLRTHILYIQYIYICIVIVWWWSSENSNLRLFALILLSSLSQKCGLPGNYLTFLAPVSPVRRCGFLAVATWQTWASRGVKLSNKNGLMLWYICVFQLYTSIAPNIPQLT